MTGELVTLPPSISGLPDPKDFARALREWMEAQIIRVRDERGEVLQPEDTFPMVRSLEKARDVLAAYRNALAGVEKICKAEIQEELTYAVGENDGVPLSSLTVPDVDGTAIKLSLDAPNVHTIDVEALKDAVAVACSGPIVIDSIRQLAAAALLVADQDAEDAFQGYVVEAVRAALDQMLALGSFTPQITKVNALRKTMSGAGDDNLAGMVGAAVRTTKDFRGITIKREEPK